jgi:hypothetical protein
LHWFCYYMIWSTEGAPWFHSFTSRCLWLECLQLGWSRVSPFHACPFSFQNRMVTLSLPHCNLPQQCVAVSIVWLQML